MLNLIIYKPNKIQRHQLLGQLVKQFLLKIKKKDIGVTKATLKPT